MNNKVGKNAEYTNRNLVRQNSSDVSDGIRRVLKKFYVNDDGTLRYESSPSELFNSEIEDGRVIVTHKSSVSTKDRKSFTKLSGLASLTNTTTRFTDYHYKRVLPLDKDELEKVNKVGTVDYWDVNSSYNFYAKAYESVVAQNPFIPENILPSFYATYASAVYDQENVQPLNTLNGNFSSELTEGFMSVFDEDDENAKSRFMKYFEDYAQSLRNIILSNNNFPEMFRNLSTAYNTYVFTDSSLPLFTSEAVRGELFPMSNKISFSTDKNTAFSNILQELKIERELVREIVGTQEDQVIPLGKSIAKYTPSPSGPPQEANLYSVANAKMWDVKEWITEKIFNNEQAGIEIGQKKESQTGADLSIQKLFTKMILAAKVNKLSKNRLRTLKEMMDGKAAYSEAVMYKIEKFDYPNSTAVASTDPIATFYIPNSSKLDICNFVDTQVKYGKRYKYTISSYDMVIGSEYSYPSVNTSTKQNDPALKIKVDYEPSIKIIETKIANIEEAVVVDHPPMAPGISFVPYRDINNKVLINLNSSTGDRLLLPVTLENSDIERFELIKKSQRRIDDKIRFKSDDISAIFEVYRTTEKPRSYQDFAGKKHVELSTGELSTAAAFRDSITPNTDYYYSLRVRDVHGNVSNPSVVYRLKMEDLEDGPHFLDIDVVDFEEINAADAGKEVVKAMRRYVQILPTVPQGLLNVKESDLLSVDTVDGVTSVVLGVADESLWNKKFKIRFTSKKTGRKVDLDVKFVVEHKLKQT